MQPATCSPCRRLLLLVFFLVSIMLRAQPPGNLAPSPWVADLPLDMDLAAVSGDARLEPGRDPAPGGRIPVRWHIPPETQTAHLTFDLEALGILPNHYDELQVEFKTEGSLVLLMPRLHAYPVNDLCRSWYSKIDMQPNTWITARFDLRLDDDGWTAAPQPLEHPELVLTISKRWLRTPGEPQDRTITLARISLVRHPVLLDFEPSEAVLERTATALTWTYMLQLSNTMLDTVRGTLSLENHTLDTFTPNWTTQSLEFSPRERKQLALVLSTPLDAPTSPPPLTSERAQVVFRPDLDEQPTVTPLHGYRPKFIWATVPPARGAWVPSAPPEEERAAIVAAADAILGEPWAVPLHGPAGHPQAYIDPASNQRPKALSWFRHLSAEGDLLEDPAVSRAYIGNIHAQNFERANLLGKAFQLTGVPEYAAAARDVFLEYCRWYPYLPVSSPASTSGLTRLHQSTLQTCFGFATAIDAYARIRTAAALGDADREEIETGFFQPELRAIYSHNVEFTNMQVHHYTTTTHAAVALDRFWNLVGDALYGTHGFYRMIEHSFTADGLAHEAGVYHWFTLAPMMEFVARMDAFGLDVMNPRFKRVFDGTLENTPDGVVTLGTLRGVYPRAYRAYRDPRYIPTLQEMGAWPPADMDADTAAQEAARSPLPLRHNTHQPNNGYLWLRETSARGFRALSINYIMQRDRGEHDRLHVELFDPERLTSEVYRITYGSRDAPMMSRTFGHTTVVIDHGDQRDLPSALAAFLDRPSLPAALITEKADSNIWPETTFSRCVAILDGIFFIGDLYHQEGEHTFDWPLYAPWEPWVAEGVGVFQTDPNADEPIDLGYPFVTSASGLTTDAMVRARVHVPRIKATSGRAENRAKAHKSLFLTAAAEPNTLVATARVPRGYRPKPGPVFVLRQAQRATARFGVALDVAPVGGTSCVQSLTVLPVTLDGGETPAPGHAAAWRLLADSGTYLVVINRTGARVTAAGIPLTAPLLVRRL